MPFLLLVCLPDLVYYTTCQIHSTSQKSYKVTLTCTWYISCLIIIIGGFYHGKLIFPKDYPFKPPRIIMVTPNGRFQTNTRLCLSISDFHPDLWNPAWSVATILTGLLSFMVSTACYSGCVVHLSHLSLLPSPLQVESTATLGSIDTPVHVKKQLAISSWSFNLQDRAFSQLFPHLCEVSIN